MTARQVLRDNAIWAPAAAGWLRPGVRATGVCWPANDDGGGCQAGGDGQGQLAALALGLMAVLVAGRRRRR